jgi:cysteinyl-tRNA synthetase
VQAAVENLDQILDVLVRRRMGLVERERLARWLDPAFAQETAKRLAAWHGMPERAPLLTALEGGAAPSPAQMLAITGELDDDLVELFIAARQAARKAKDFASADTLRTHLRAQGIIIEDLPTGIRWKSA